MSAIQAPPAPDTVPLVYTIASSTQHSGKYGPSNIMVDKPTDQSSRWSGAFQGNAKQWIMLRLESLAVLKTITFGKYYKPHPCNMKELKVFVGMSEDHMSEVLHAGLKNDTIPETFPLKHINSSGVTFPTRYIKIMPVIAHGQNFHISVWHVSLAGIIDTNYVEQIRSTYDEFRENAVLRYVLKHLRQRRLLTPYQAILSRADIQLEHPLVTQFHENLVLQGNWSKSETLLDQMSSAGLFDSHLNSCQPRSIWTRLTGTDADGDIPPARGGHSMCMDPDNDLIYVFGGWNGESSLDDFWVYDIKEDKWRVISPSTTHERNAPGARSCHKMVFDTKTGSIYLLGRLTDEDGLKGPDAPAPRGPYAPHQGYTSPPLPQHQQPNAASPGNTTTPEPPKVFSSEFYRYHTRGLLAGQWEFLSTDTASSGGPPLIFDHQMAMDSDAQILYVFGGRVVDGDWNNARYSGLYSYNVNTGKWKSLQQPLADPMHGSQVIPSRFGHSMVLDSASKTLYIFAGQREDKYLSDMYTYNVETGVATEIFANFTVAGGPDACFTQRAVIDPALKELYVFCGLTRSPASGPQNTLRAYLSNWVYKYDSRPGKWMSILRQPDLPVSELPLPRFAHQVVYNPNTKSVFLHGGNAGGASSPDLRAGREADGEVVPTDAAEDNKDGSASAGKERRLDDFWRMELRRPGPSEIIRQAKFQIRRQQFREMCEDEAPVRALNFLQTQVSSVVDHSNVKETEIFRSLLTHLLSPSPTSPTFSSHSRSSASSATSSNSSISSLEHEDSREVSNRPQKRSRGERGSSGVWMNIPPQDDTSKLTGGDVQHIQNISDPVEALIRGEDADSLSGIRYTQRTEVFECILKFITDGEKQPTESLLDLVERDRCGGEVD